MSTNKQQAVLEVESMRRNGLTVVKACKRAGIQVPTYYTLRKQVLPAPAPANGSNWSAEKDRQCAGELAVQCDDLVVEVAALKRLCEAQAKLLASYGVKVELVTTAA